MSFEQQNNNSTLPTTENLPDAEQEQQQPPQQQKKKDEQITTPNNTSWVQRSTKIYRNAGLDLVKQQITQDITVNHAQTQVYILPTVPTYMAVDQLIPTGSSDLPSTLNELISFFESCELLQDKKFHIDGYNFHGSYFNRQLTAPIRYSCYLYRTNHNEIVFDLQRVDGCGIAFAHLFNALNQALGKDKSRQIATFEAPKLLNTLQINALETHYTNLSSNADDTCVFAHGIQSPISWSINTLNNMFSSMYQQYKKSLTMGDEYQTDEIIIPIASDDDNDDTIEVPLPPKAQAHMITQSYDILNSTLSNIIDNMVQFQTTEPKEFEQLQQFITGLFSFTQDGFSTLYALLEHTNFDVKIATFKFLHFAMKIRPDFISQLPTERISSLYQQSAQAIEQQISDPFNAMNCETLIATIEQLEDVCFQSSQ